YKEPSQLIEDYFEILQKQDTSLIKLIDDMKISKTHWFPIYGFSKNYSDLNKLDLLKKQQDKKISDLLDSINCDKYLALGLTSINDVLTSINIADSYRTEGIFCLVYHNKIPLDDLESYLESFSSNRELDFKKLLCLYDQLKYRS
ncbi:SIR2 family protein, partial [Acinetobacter baumannii]|nr:SIR2 family protein [Acinetobacter baumannii]